MATKKKSRADEAVIIRAVLDFYIDPDHVDTWRSEVQDQITALNSEMYARHGDDLCLHLTMSTFPAAAKTEKEHEAQRKGEHE